MKFSLWAPGNDSIQPRIYVNGLAASVEVWIERLPDRTSWVPRVKSRDRAQYKPCDKPTQITALQAAMIFDRDKELRSQIVEALARRIGLETVQDIYKLTFEDIVRRGHIKPLQVDQLWRTRRLCRHGTKRGQDGKKGRR